MMQIANRCRRWAAVFLALPLTAWAAADPQIAQIVENPTSVTAGSTYSYTITVANNAPDAATNTRLNFSLPAGGASFVSASVGSNCAGVSATAVQCDLGSIAGGGGDVRTVVLTWRATVAGPTSIESLTTLSADSDINSANNTQTRFTPVVPGANLALVISDAPDPVAPNSQVTYTLTASNAGPNAVGPLVVVSNLSASSTFVSATGSGWSCSHSAGRVTCTRAGTHAVGAAIPPISIVATVTATSGFITADGTVATASGGVPESDNADNTATATTTILTGADVQITAKSITSATPIAAGSVVSFRIAPRNAGPDAATGVSVIDDLPAGWTFSSTAGTAGAWSCSHASGRITCTRATMPVGATDDIVIQATAPASVAEAGSTYTNTATISAAGDPVPGNNSASVNATVVRNGADLRLGKVKVPGLANLNDVLTSTITVTNDGPSTATGTLRVIDVLTNESFVDTTGSGAGWSCASAANVVTCDHGNAGGLAVGASLPNLVIRTRVTGTPVATNQACTGSSVPTGIPSGNAVPPTNPGGDPNTTNDCFTSNTDTVNPATLPDPAVLSVAVTTPTGGDNLVSATENSATIRVVVQNKPPAAANATGLRIRVAVPTNVFVVGQSTFSGITVAVGDVNGVANGSTATFNCTPAAEAFECIQSGGDLRPNDHVVVTANVNRPLQGTAGDDVRVDLSNWNESDRDLTNNTAVATIRVTALADLEMAGATASPSPVLAGENTTLVYTYRNSGTDAAADASVNLTYSFFLADGTTPAAPGDPDPGFEILSLDAGTGVSCTVGGGSPTGAVIRAANPTVLCSGPGMASGATRTITIVARPLSQVSNPTRVISGLATVSTTTTESTSANNSRTATFTVQSNAINLLVDKSDLLDPVPYAGPTSTFLDYRVRVSSTGPSFGTNVRFVETMNPPAGKSVAFVCDTATLGGACNAASLCTSPVTSGNQVSFTCTVPAGNATTGAAAGTLAANQFKDVFLRYRVVDQPAATGDVFISNARVLSDQLDIVAGDDVEEERTTVRNRVDIRVTKAASQPSVAVGQAFSWTVNVENRGPGDSLQTDLTDTLPAGTIVTATPTWTKSTGGSGNCTLAGLVLSCPLGRLNAAATASVSIPVRVDALPTGATQTNTATVDVDQAKTGAEDFPGGNNTASAVVNFTTVPSSIAGTVYSDLNRNGSLDATPTDGRLAGVTLTLYAGTSCSGTPVATTTTDASGNYLFAGLTTGATYTVCETQPTGYDDGGVNLGTNASSPGANAITVSNLPGTGSAGNHFAELVNGASIAGRVWLDTNHNGIIDTGEAGIGGVSIVLTGTDDLGAPVNRTTTTAADGSWAFTGLRPGTYSVTEPTQPANTLNGRTVAGTSGGAATAVGSTPSAITGIVLAANAASTANHFGEIPAARVAGRIWFDADNDGVIDAGESGISGVGVTLSGTDDNGAAVNLTQTTGSDGSYNFANLRPGTYTVSEPTQPAATGNGLTVAGSLGGTATSVTTLPSAISGIVLPAGGAAIDNNFGEVPDSPDLLVSKRHLKPVFTVGMSGGYEISVRNGGSLPSVGAYTVEDVLPTGLTLAAPPAATGWACTGATGGTSFSCISNTVLAAGASHPNVISVSVNVGAAAQAASPVNNVVMVSGGGETAGRGPTDGERAAMRSNPASLPVCGATPSHNICRDPVTVQLAAAVSGTVWTDNGTAPQLLDGGDRRMPGWLVEVIDVASGSIVGRATTGTTGTYRVGNLEPGVELAVRFRDPISNVVFGYPVNGETAPGSSGASCISGTPPRDASSSCVRQDTNPRLVVMLAPGAELPQQSLPIDPSGVVYDAATRAPVPGSIVTLAPSGTCPGWAPATSVVAATLGGYTINGDRISMPVGTDGYYQFLFAPAAPASCNFALTVTPPARYAFVSTLIPPSAGPLVPAGGTGSTFAVQPQPTPPTADVGPGTAYYLLFTGGSAGANIVHNHIPLDPTFTGPVTLSKTGDRSVAEIGDSVRYTLTLTMGTGRRPTQNTIVDRLPAGFTYIPGTATVNGAPLADPAGGVGPTLAFNLGAMPASNQLVLRYRARVGVGAAQGDGINRAQAQVCLSGSSCVDAGFVPLASASPTNRAEYRVRVQGGVFTTDACVLGKIFVDCNHNHVQDPEELGIPGVRLVLSDGTMLISDSEGKYSVCGLPPRGHVMRADPSTLPRGSRLTTSSNRNLGDAGSLWLDLKNGELHRADFIEGSCSNTVLEQVKARRAQGEVRSVETEKQGAAPLRFDSKAHQLDTRRSPQQGTDGANQLAPKPRAVQPVPPSPARDETNVPTPLLPMNQPPPRGRSSGDAPDAAASGAASNGGSNGTR